MVPGRRHALPVSTWPTTDQALWQSINAEGDILDGSGPAAHWAPTTRDNVRKAYGYWLDWLGRSGFLDPMETAHGPHHAGMDQGLHRSPRG